MYSLEKITSRQDVPPALGEIALVRVVNVVLSIPLWCVFALEQDLVRSKWRNLL